MLNDQTPNGDSSSSFSNGQKPISSLGIVLQNTREFADKIRGDIENVMRGYVMTTRGSPIQENQNYTFAWEERGSGAEIAKKAREMAVDIAEQTDALVIIGYSFPKLNREIDTQIINSLQKEAQIYIQNLDFEGVSNRLRQINKNVNIQHTPEAGIQSYIPQ